MRNFSETFRTLTTNVLTTLLAGLIAVLLGALALLAILPTIAHAENCPNAVYRTGPSAHLPDCRVYELVSPPEKNGGYINEGSFLTSPEGASVGFTSNSGFAGATSNLDSSTGYQSNRSETNGKPEWSTVAETEPEDQFIDNHNLLKTDFQDQSFGDLSTLEKGEQSLESGVRLWQLQEIAAPESSLAFYLVGSDGANAKVGPAVPSTASGLAQNREIKSEGEEIRVLGISADTSHMVYIDPEPKGPNQWPFAAPGALLEYVGTGNTEPLLVVPHPATEDNNCPQQLLGGTSTFNNIATQYPAMAARSSSPMAGLNRNARVQVSCSHASKLPAKGRIPSRSLSRRSKTALPAKYLN